jgi:hypothetical protein
LVEEHGNKVAGQYSDDELEDKMFGFIQMYRSLSFGEGEGG